MQELTYLANLWMAAKRAEADSIEKRRKIEDDMRSALDIPDSLDGTTTVKTEGLEIKIVGRLTKKVDSDLLQEIAAEHGLTQHLGNLFRWKPEIDAKQWAAADESITAPLLGAITTKPGRASFSITKKGE